MESEFYVILPSNSSMQYFPDNKTSNFVTKLSKTVQLDGECEVGLAEIDYPHTWYNISEGKILWKFMFQMSFFKKSFFNLDIARKYRML